MTFFFSLWSLELSGFDFLSETSRYGRSTHSPGACCGLALLNECKIVVTIGVV